MFEDYFSEDGGLRTFGKRIVHSIVSKVTRPPHNSNGGLTLIPMPGMEGVALQLQAEIHAMSTKLNKQRTPVDIAIPVLDTYSNGEPDYMLGKRHVGRHDCYIIRNGTGTPEKLLQLLFVVAHLSARDAARINIISGYYPQGRSDKDEGSKRFALTRMYMDMLMGASHGRLRKIICADPHSEGITTAGRSGIVTPINYTRVLLRSAIERAQVHNLPICLAFPDGSAQKRFREAMKAISEEMGINLPVVTIYKHRSSSTSISKDGISGDTASLKGSLVILLDDEINTGGSVLAAARQFKDEFGAKIVWAEVTHGVLSTPKIFEGTNCPVDKVLCTDTIPVFTRPSLAKLIASGRLEVITWIKELVEIIYYDHWNENIRGMR
jgi:ribose-phosphate pyrophosphokinase